MNLKAIIPQGQTEITVNGLHQWDYGQKLEIHSPSLPAIVEVHFACVGMTSAVVRACNVSGGVATAPIPDQCLEQTAPIVAWVFEINGTTGTTTYKITLPIEARPRPEIAPTLPTEVSDKYTELITSVNAKIAEMAGGNIKVKSASYADTAGSATNATNATNATKATNADKATTAGSATTASVLEDFVHGAKSETSGQVDVGLSSGVYVVWDADIPCRLLYVDAQRNGHTEWVSKPLSGYTSNRYRFDCANGTLGKTHEYHKDGEFEGNIGYADSIDCSYVQLMQFFA